eukprot:364174-Chlamydomonas_euryale.AAC.5
MYDVGALAGLAPHQCVERCVCLYRAVVLKGPSLLPLGGTRCMPAAAHLRHCRDSHFALLVHIQYTQRLESTDLSDG